VPKNAVATLNREINRALIAPDVKDRFATLTLDITPGSPEDFLKLLESEDRRWKGVQKEVKIRLD